MPPIFYPNSNFLVNPGTTGCVHFVFMIYIKCMGVIELAARAATANPFGAERFELDASLGQTSADDPDVIAKGVVRVSRALDEAGLCADTTTVRGRAHYFAVLFEAFHLFLAAIDDLIVRDLQDGEPPQIAFMKDLFQHLQKRGLKTPQHGRAFELFYQMRRAHRFISSALRGSGLRPVRERAWNSVFSHDIEQYEAFLWQAIESFSTLIVGQTGTGKSRIAKAIGRSGFIALDAKASRFERAIDETFVGVNLSEFVETLLESELFGHEKGAFTGAISNYDGWLARCPKHGALFLDEIGEISQAVQIKLLRVLQDRRYTPVGGHKEKRFSGRVIAATHQPVEKLRVEGKFRDDFFFRVRSNVIEIPSLSDQLSAGLKLSEPVASILSELQSAAAVARAEEIANVLEKDYPKNYTWPGNFRELEQSIRHILLHGDPPDIVTTAERGSWPQQAAKKALPLEEVSAQYLTALRQRTDSIARVADIARVDRRTAKRYLDLASDSD